MNKNTMSADNHPHNTQTTAASSVYSTVQVLQ